MKRTIAVAIVVLALAGCATTKQWSAIGGSRAAGIVKLSYEYSAFEKPRIDDWQGLELAADHCVVWGYFGAQALGDETETCSNSIAGDCVTWVVVREYQCLGGGFLLTDLGR